MSFLCCPWKQHVVARKHFGLLWLVQVEPCQRAESTYSLSHCNLTAEQCARRSELHLGKLTASSPWSSPVLRRRPGGERWPPRRVLTTWDAVLPRRTAAVRTWQRSRGKRRHLPWCVGITPSAWRRSCPGERRTAGVESPPALHRRKVRWLCPRRG